MPSNEETITRWLSRIKAAKKVRESWWRDAKQYSDGYSGDFPADFDQTVQPNWVKRVIDSAVEHLYFKNVSVEIPSRRAQDFDTAAPASALINTVLRTAKAEPKFREAVRDALLFGSGYLKIGYHTEQLTEDAIAYLQTDALAENEQLMQGMEVTAVEGENHADHIAQHQALLDTPEIHKIIQQTHGVKGALNIAQHIEQHRQLKRLEERRGRLYFDLEPEEVWIKYVDPRGVLIDPNAACLDDARWVAFRLVRSLDDIKADPAYRNTSKLEGGDVEMYDDAEGEYEAVLERLRSSSRSERDDDNLVELYEVWDRKEMMRYVICPQLKDRFLLKEATPFPRLPGFFPLCQVQFNRSPASGRSAKDQERVYGLSHVASFWAEQLELNTLVNQMLEIVRHNVPRYLAHASVNREVLDALTSPDVGGIYQLTNTGQGAPLDNPSMAVHALVQHGVPESLLQAIQAVTQMIQLKSGFSEIVLGGNAPSGQTATATQIAAQSASATVDNMLTRVGEAYVHLAEMTRALIKQFYTKPRAVLVLGKDGEALEAWVGQSVMNDTAGEELLVRSGSQSAAVDALRRNQNLQAWSLLRQSEYFNKRELDLWVAQSLGISPSSKLVLSEEEMLAKAKQMGALQAAQTQAQATPPATPNPADLAAQLRSEMGQAANPGTQLPGSGMANPAG